jgi:hypothetical protein
MAQAACILAVMVVAAPGIDPPAGEPQDHTSLQWAYLPRTGSSMPLDQDQPGTVAMLLDGPARSIGFQGLLTNEQGNPIPNPNGAHELDFRIYDAAAGGAVVGEVLDVVVTLDNGVASTQIGPLDPAWFDGTARWVGVTVDNGTELEPLIPLGAAPYAFRVDRVASLELDDHIELGGRGAGGSLTVYSGDVQPVTITLDGPNGQVRVANPDGPGGINLYGQAQIIETRDSTGTPVALYGYDGVSGGAASLLGTSAGTIGLLLDGSANGGEGGVVQLFNEAADETISLTAADATIRVGSVNGGVAGDLHLYPAAGGPSRIHLDGETGDARLGVTGFSSGDFRTYSAGGGIETIHLDGGNGQISLTDATQETLLLDGAAAGGGSEIALRNSAGAQTVEIDADESDHAALRLGDATGTTTVEIEAQESVGNPGSRIALRNGNGVATVVLDAEVGGQALGRITASGSVGIGTTSPDHELVIQGDDPAVQIRDDTTNNSPNAARLELLENSSGDFDGGAFFWWNGETNKLLVGTKVSGVNTNVLVIDRATSSVGIGTQAPGAYRLAVNGPIRAKEIVVETGWSDFVFEPDYDLPSLKRIEEHIREHGHLPDIPSAKEVAANGVKVGEMESKLLQKIEELTLHLIDMNKRLKTLERENAQLRSGLGSAAAQVKEVR